MEECAFDFTVSYNYEEFKEYLTVEEYDKAFKYVSRMAKDLELNIKLLPQALIQGHRSTIMNHNTLPMKFADTFKRCQIMLKQLR